MFKSIDFFQIFAAIIILSGVFLINTIVNNHNLAYALSNPISSPVSPTPTPAPICDRYASIALSNTAAAQINPGEDVNNELVITNPNDAACGPTLYGISRGYPQGWVFDIAYSVLVPAGTSSAVPFKVTSSTTASLGDYTYSLYVGDSRGGNLTGVTGNVTVHDTIAPVVSIISPSDGSIVPRNSTVQISAAASDNVKVAKVEFYVNGALRCTDTTAAYGCSFATPNKKGISYDLLSKAYDTSGNTSQSSVKVTSK